MGDRLLSAMLFVSDRLLALAFAMALVAAVRLTAGIAAGDAPAAHPERVVTALP